MSKYLLLLILISAVCSQTDSASKSNVTAKPAYVDELSYEKYRSQISIEARYEYTTWIGYKSSFSLKKNDLTRMYKTFSPEDQSYYPRIYSFGWFFYGSAILCFIMLVLYFIGRLFCKRFRGPKQIGDYYSTATYCLIGNN
jgi:hypothetical protein